MYRVDVLYALGDVIMLIMFLLLLLHYFCIFRCNFGTEINQKIYTGWPTPTALPSAQPCRLAWATPNRHLCADG